MIAAVEDPLSEAIVRRMVAVRRPDLTIWTVMGNCGYGYLRKRCRELNRTAAAVPVLLLTDQDVPTLCPADLIEEWLPVPRNANLLFRVAVMEVESWVIAHRRAFERLLHVAEGSVPADTDAIADPKQFVVNLARGSRSREIRADLVPTRGSTAVVGPGYNPRMAEFANTRWDPAEAAQYSRSLARAVARLDNAFR